MKLCVVEKCEKPAPSGRMCYMHRARMQRHGTVADGPGMSGTLAERYERFVIRQEGCWGWVGATNDRGYPQIRGGYAHRISWEIHNGPIPDGLFVCHRCDNPPCTNPEHLFLGTHRDNMNDAMAKGRLRGSGPNQRRGEAVKNAKLTDEAVLRIRELCDAGAKQRDVAAQFGVSQRAVNLVAQRKSWRHV